MIGTIRTPDGKRGFCVAEVPGRDGATTKGIYPFDEKVTGGEVCNGDHVEFEIGRVQNVHDHLYYDIVTQMKVICEHEIAT